MTKYTLPTIDYLRKRLRYEPETGKLFWLACDDMPQRWKTRFSWKEAFTANDENGYRLGAVNYQTLKAHRVAWALHHGEWPSDHIDHINGIKFDNRIVNLRVVTNAENMRNKAMRACNTSGFTGVYFHKPTGKWQAKINVNGRGKSLGLFHNIAEAAEVRAKANIEYGFTDRHGKANVITSAPKT